MAINKVTLKVCYRGILRARWGRDTAYFDLGYRRYEWKCNAANAAPMEAAKRLGFTFEGIFRQAMVVKGRNRDTAWFSIIDSEWPALRDRFQKWLLPVNFDAEGRQINRLR